MIALDTNVILRLLLHDDEAQARAAERLVIRARREGTALFVADVVLCELVWVLKRRVSMSRGDIAELLDRLFRTELIVLSHAVTVENALAAYRAGRGDFADYLIREQSRRADATEVVTFDKALKGEAGFRVL